jgi:hypothetical protein
MAVQVIGSTYLAETSANNELKVALASDSASAGFALLAAEKGKTPTGRVVRSVGVDNDRRLRVQQETPFIQDYPLSTTINTRKWANILTTQTLTLANGRYTLNSSGITTVTTGSMLKSYKFVPFLQNSTTYCEMYVMWNQSPVANWVAEWGFSDQGSATTATFTSGIFFRLTNGAFKGVAVYNAVEYSVDLGTVPTFGVSYDSMIEVTPEYIFFWIDGVVVGTLQIQNTLFAQTIANALPVFARTYNAGTAPSVAIKLEVGNIMASVGGQNLNRLWPTVMAANGDSCVQAPSGSTVGQTANYSNSAAPSSASLSNTAAGYNTLGGQFQFAATAGAETDYLLFSYTCPVGKTLVIRGVWIDSVNTGAAVATTATLLQWAVAVGNTADNLTTSDAATAKSPARVGLGFQSFPVGAAIGVQANMIDKNFDAPLVINSNERFQILLKMPVGTATASQIIRGIVGVNGYFE